MLRDMADRGSFSESLFTGQVTHQRAFEIEHQFTYPVWMSLSKLGRSNLPALARPRTSKYLCRAQLAQLIHEPLAANTEIWLLTQPSLMGRSFNPVSFYFVTQNNRLQWMVAQITNTPWDEQHSYVLKEQGAGTWTFQKTFHVSPFMPMELQYRWRFRISDHHININMKLFKQHRQVFSAVLDLKPIPAKLWTPLKLRLRHPMQNLRTLIRIYYQAAVLKLKGARCYAHPNNSPSR